MTALPASLAPAEPIARAVYESGWRPAPAEGPTRDELVALLTAPHGGAHASRRPTLLRPAPLIRGGTHHGVS